MSAKPPPTLVVLSLLLFVNLFGHQSLNPGHALTALSQNSLFTLTGIYWIPLIRYAMVTNYRVTRLRKS